MKPFVLTAACLVFVLAGSPRLRLEDAPQVPAPAAGALAQADDLAFTGRFCAWLETLDARQVAAARTALADGWRADAWPTARRTRTLAWLDRRWAALDGAAFLRDCATHRQDRDSKAQAAVLLAEFARDREAAMRHYEELPLRDGPPQAVAEFLLQAASDDPVWLLRRCQQLPEWDAGDGLVQSSLYLAWAKQDPAAAWAAMLKEPSDQLRFITGSRLLRTQLGKPPEQAVAWLKATPGRSDRQNMVYAFFSGLSAHVRKAEALPILRLWDDPAGWDALVSRPPYGAEPEAWVQEMIPLLPPSHRARALLGIFGGFSIRIPMEGDPPVPAFDAIGDPELQRRVRELAVATGSTDLLEPVNPKPPKPTDEALRAAFWNEPFVFHWMVSVHGIEARKWAVREYATDPEHILERLLARPDTTHLNLEINWLADTWPAARCREETLRLIAQPGAAARIAARAFAESWFQREPQDAIRTLGTQHPALLAAPLERGADLMHSLSNKIGADRTRQLLSGISHPVIRATALNSFNALVPPPAESAEQVLLRLTAMPPSPARNAAIGKFGARLRSNNTPPPGVLLQLVLALDPDRHGDLRDSLLRSCAVHGSLSGEDQKTLWPVLARGIRDPDIRRSVLAETLPEHRPDGAEVELMNLLAELPAGEQRTEAIRTYAERLSRPACLRAITGSHPPVVRAALLRVLLKDDHRLIKPHPVMEAITMLPPAWQSADMLLKLRRHRAQVDPAAVWPELAAELLEGATSSPAGADLLFSVWATTDPQAALAAWLATGPSPLLHGAKCGLAEVLYLPEIMAGREPVFPAADRAGVLESDLRGSLWRVGLDSVAAARCLRLAPPERQGTLGHTLCSWAGNRQPADAIKWAEALPAGADRQIVAKELLELLWRQDPEIAKAFLLREAARDPGIIATLAKPIRGEARNFLTDHLVPARKVRHRMAFLAQIDPAEAAEEYARPVDAATRSNFRLGLLDAALRNKQPDAIARAIAEIARDGSPEEQTDAATTLARITFERDPEKLPAALAGLPWSQPRLVATRQAIRLAMEHSNQPLAAAIVRACPDPVHRDELASLVFTAADLQEAADLAAALKLAAATIARAAIVRALVAGHSGEALRAALMLPDPEAAPLVTRILASLPTEAARAAALDALPDDAARARARQLPSSAR